MSVYYSIQSSNVFCFDFFEINYVNIGLKLNTIKCCTKKYRIEEPKWKRILIYHISNCNKLIWNKKKITRYSFWGFHNNIEYVYYVYTYYIKYLQLERNSHQKQIKIYMEPNFYFITINISINISMYTVYIIFLVPI